RVQLACETIINHGKWPKGMMKLPAVLPITCLPQPEGPQKLFLRRLPKKTCPAGLLIVELEERQAPSASAGRVRGGGTYLGSFASTPSMVRSGTTKAMRQ